MRLPTHDTQAAVDLRPGEILRPLNGFLRDIY